MKFYGHANLQKNQIQNAALESSATFPEAPVVGLLAFVNSIVYICVGAGQLPVWVPLTNEITAYTHNQPTTSQTWTIEHNLNTTSVNIQVYDNLSRVVIPAEIETNDMNTATISFNTASAGRAVVVSGQFDGNRKPTYAYTHYQSSASTSWVITHNLGYNPIVRVFIGDQEVQPLTITHNSTNQVTITFSTAQVGYVRFI
jgi:hypothetical protein